MFPLTQTLGLESHSGGFLSPQLLHWLQPQQCLVLHMKKTGRKAQPLCRGLWARTPWQLASFLSSSLWAFCIMAVEVFFSFLFTSSPLRFYLSKEKKKITTNTKRAFHFIPSLVTHYLPAVAMVIKNLCVLFHGMFCTLSAWDSICKHYNLATFLHANAGLAPEI